MSSATRSLEHWLAETAILSRVLPVDRAIRREGLELESAIGADQVAENSGSERRGEAISIWVCHQIATRNFPAIDSVRKSGGEREGSNSAVAEQNP